MCEPIEWIRDSSRAPCENKDLRVFISVVHAIFTQDPDHIVRDLLTYLLLRRNPATNAEVPLDKPFEVSVIVPEKVEMLRDSSGREIARYMERKRAHPYPILMLLEEIVHTSKARWVNGEETTLLILATWLISEELKPVDLLTKCACLRLADKSRVTPIDICENEFVCDRVNCAMWLVKELDRLFVMSFTNDEIALEVSYLGAFASLVRASRMASSDHPVQQILRDEIAWLQTETTRR